MSPLEPTESEPGDIEGEILAVLEELGCIVIRKPDQRLLEIQDNIIRNRDRIRREIENRGGNSEAN